MLAGPMEPRQDAHRPPHPASRHLVTALAVAAAIAYFATLHTLIVTHALPVLALALVLAPWLFIVGPPIARVVRTGSARQRSAVALVVGAALAVAAWFGPRIVEAFAGRAETVLYVENLAFFGWLAALFAVSLAPGRIPLVTRIARKTRRGDMPPSVIRYTRAVTIGWAVFFVVTMTISTALFFSSREALWSLFVNVLIGPLVGLGFTVEYAVRRTLLRDVAHAPFLAAIRDFRERGRAEPER
jgi:uncharacterized membrane protein